MRSDTPATGRDWPGAAMAVALAGLAAYVLAASAAFTRFGALFPTAVAIVMLVLAAALLLRALRLQELHAAAPGAALWRPVALGAVVAAWMALTPLAGFYAASIGGFFAAGLVARFEPVTARTVAVQFAVSVVVVSAFYLLFSMGLGVRFQ